MPHLPGSNEVGHGADRILNRHAGIHSVQIVEIDHIDSQALERQFAAAARALGTPIDRPAPIARTGYNPEFGCQHDSLSPTPESLADFDLRIAIDIGCVEE